MLKNKNVLIPLSALFALAEITLSLFHQVTRGAVSAYASYAAIVLACIFCVVFIEPSSQYVMTQTALICTAFADYFLVISRVQQRLPAMLFFSITQICYFILIHRNMKSQSLRKVHLIAQASLSVFAVILTLAVLQSKADALSLVSLFYFANLLSNIVFAFIDFKASPLLAIGLLLFICCDITVGLSMIDLYFDIPSDSVIYSIINPGFDLAWAFYIPSQTLLALSLLSSRIKAKAPKKLHAKA